MTDDPISFPTPAPGEVLTTPAQASFTPDGQRLVLSIKGLAGADFTPDRPASSLPNGRMVVFSVGANGQLSAPVITPFGFTEATRGPFSFIFADAETVIVVHANSLPGTVASYTINPDNTLSLLSDPPWLQGNLPLAGSIATDVSCTRRASVRPLESWKLVGLLGSRI